ncbi:MAG: PTS lactose/cellobiose transporter subunit IIA [Lachnospiraceae bacterium]|nr:PTS lactose/cellobiose transporter subunit IIA [Lachnospiraceae bacterium]
MERENELVSVAMQIILHAGDSRIKLTEALKHARAFDFEQAERAMEEAKEEIVLAHNSQTEIIQGEAGGTHYEYSLLFTHAQDTLMTINSEVRMAQEMIQVLKVIAEKIG